MIAAFEEGLVKFLSDDPEIANQITDDRFFPQVAPEGTPGPYFCYTLVSAQRDKFLNNPSPNCKVEYQLDVWGQDHDQVRDLADVISTKLNNLVRGFLGECEVKGIDCDPAAAENEDDGDGSDARWYRRRLDLNAWIVDNRVR